jgi:hypothetical protein
MAFGEPGKHGSLWLIFTAQGNILTDITSEDEEILIHLFRLLRV